MADPVAIPTDNDNDDVDQEEDSQATVPCDYEEDRHACMPEDHFLTGHHMLAMSKGHKMILYSSWRRLQYIKSIQPADSVLNLMHLNSMDYSMLRHLFLEWTDLQLHENLQEADEMREGEELNYHENVAYQMEDIDHDDYNIPPSSSHSVDYTTSS